MRYPVSILSGFLLLFCTCRASAQDSRNIPISGNFDSIPFSQFVKTVEMAAGPSLHFYYNPSQLDSVFISFTIKDQPLEKVMQQVFAGSAFHYSFDGQGHVFVSKGLQVRTELPESFFNSLARSADTAAGNNREEVLLSGTSNRSRPGKAVVSQNKLFEIGRKTNQIQQGQAIVS